MAIPGKWNHFILTSVMLLAPQALFAEPSADDLLALLKQQSTAGTLSGNYRIHIVRPDWERTIALQIQENQISNSYRATITAPHKLKGTAFIKEQGQLWMYLPKLRRRIRISAGMMQQSWMGSDLSNQDLMDPDALIKNYQHKIINWSVQPGDRIATIESLPDKNRPALWGKLLRKVSTQGVIKNIRFFDRQGVLVRSIEFSAVKKFSGRLLPTRWRVTPVSPAGNFTDLELLSLQFNALSEATDSAK